MPLTVIPPPVQYDHPYYNGPVIEYVLPLEQVRSYCQQIGNGYADACSGDYASERVLHHHSTN
jgi:hypothetical protein